jgi:hypothetical protein
MVFALVVTKLTSALWELIMMREGEWKEKREYVYVCVSKDKPIIINR